MSHHPWTFRDPEDQPDDPDRPEGGEPKAPDMPVNELETRLFKGRKVMIFGQINDKLARDVVARILALADESSKPIQVYVNSPGGHVESGDSIHDIIKFVRSTVPVYMIGTGWVASAGALIYSAGERKHRFCLPNTRFLLHQPMGGVQGPATDIDIEAREIIKARERIARVQLPFGDAHLAELPEGPLVLIAAGTGMAQMHSLIEHCRAQGFAHPVHLYWGVRRPEDFYALPHWDEWKGLANLHLHKVVSDLCGWQGRCGLLHEAVCEDFPGLGSLTVYASGSPAMVYATLDALVAAGMDAHQMRADVFAYAPRD